jgi:hypothetical protein
MIKQDLVFSSVACFDAVAVTLTAWQQETWMEAAGRCLCVQQQRVLHTTYCAAAQQRLVEALVE